MVKKEPRKSVSSSASSLLLRFCFEFCFGKEAPWLRSSWSHSNTPPNQNYFWWNPLEVEEPDCFWDTSRQETNFQNLNFPRNRNCHCNRRNEASILSRRPPRWRSHKCNLDLEDQWPPASCPWWTCVKWTESYISLCIYAASCTGCPKTTPVKH